VSRKALIAAPSGPSTFLNGARRAVELEALVDGETVDLLVIGGGVTGAGVALDAASRGLSVALVERHDLASGTSSFSSKLAHGGIRYLAKGQFGVAWESARERHLLATVTAPHLVRALPIVMPVYTRGDQFAVSATELGFRVGDRMKAAAGTSRKLLPSTHRIGATEARTWQPALRHDGLRRALMSWDGQLEDDARLVVALARTAAGYGARVITRCSVESIERGAVQVRDGLTGLEHEIRARHIVNATGVWAGTVVDGIELSPSRGSHLLIDAKRFGSPRAMLSVQQPGHVGRVVFAIPRPGGLMLVGLTDEPVDGPIEDVPAVPEHDEAFLLDAVSRVLEVPLRADDVIGRFAGLRPLLRASADSTADISRRHAVLDDPRTGTVTVVGGKLTTYRQMAQDAVDRVLSRGELDAGPCVTARTPLVGAGPASPAPVDNVSAGLVRRFGSEAAEIAALAGERPELLEPVIDESDVLGVDFVAAIEREGALSADDILDRRTRLGLVLTRRAAAAAAAHELLGAVPA
jgi:glycerol-3-phosphate dehydrogenase